MLALVERIERAEAELMALAAAAAHGRGEPGFVMPLAGGVATCAGPDSPFTKVAGLGFAGVPAEADLDEVERAFPAQGAPVQVELSHVADPAIAELLTARGYSLVGFEDVLALRLDRATPAARRAGRAARRPAGRRGGRGVRGRRGHHAAGLDVPGERPAPALRPALHPGRPAAEVIDPRVGTLAQAAGGPRFAANGTWMSSRGQSLSVFVVQRSFRRVRRGYDPDEVDRHLQLVSRWFTSTDIGVALTHERTALDRREATVAAREAELERTEEERRLEAKATLEGARRRADADTGKAEKELVEARIEAARILAEAEAARTEMLDGAERERASILDEAKAQAAAAEIVAEAREQAEALLEAAGVEAEGIRASAHAEAEALTEARLATARDEVAYVAAEERHKADEELAAYVERRRREADRLVEAARRDRGSDP